MSKQAAINQLRELGAVRAVAEFSGGHDEGGIDNINVYNNAGQKLAYEWEWRSDPVSIYFDEVVEGKYYAFAGDFYVSGTVSLNAETGETRMDGEESVESYEPFSETIEEIR